MAVISRELHWTGASGSHNRDGKRKYESVYRCYTSSPLDQAAVVIGYFAANGPYIGDIYTYANDLDTQAFCDGISPRRESQHSTMWIVTVSYSESEEDDRDKDEDGNPTEDPLQFYDDVQTSYAQFTAPVEQATNWTPLPNRPAGTLGPVINSAGIVYDPPLERDESRTVVRIIKNLPSYTDALYAPFQDAVNSTTTTINKKFVKYTATWQPYQAKIQNISGTFRIKNNVKYWEIAHEIHVWRKGWRVQVIDRGLHAKAGVGDPDGHGGTIGFAPDGSALPTIASVPPIRRVLDVHGEPVSTPVLLDGQGKPLPQGAAPFLITYAIYDEKSFAPLSL